MNTVGIFKFYTRSETPDNETRDTAKPAQQEEILTESATVAAIKKILQRICDKP